MSFSIKLLVLFCMIFCHVVDDYYLQGILASMKQKRWWEEQFRKGGYSEADREKYKNDYRAALAAHGFSWAFMICIPAIVWGIIYIQPVEHYLGLLMGVCLVEAGLHSLVDHAKANDLTINLIQDQTIHLAQILSVWISFILIW